MDFFEEFRNAKKEFTYGDSQNMALNVLQVGLVAKFYLLESYLPERRKGVENALCYYIERYGENLKWGFFEDIEYKKLPPTTLDKLYAHINDYENTADFLLSSQNPAWSHVGSYAASALLRPDWFEQVHKRVSFLYLYLPVECLKDDGYEEWQNLLFYCCQELKPIHGLAGLGMQVCNDFEENQEFEYEVAQEFTCIDIGSPALGSPYLRTGICSINWYTFLNEEWLAKLGGVDALKYKLDDERIQIISYSHGVMIKAGKYPELGWVRKNPYPELYLKVNEALKPIRAEKVGSFHFGSISDEVRFNRETSNIWMRRFDEQKATDLHHEEKGSTS